MIKGLQGLIHVLSDGKGPLPDSPREILFIALIGLIIVVGFGFFSGLDAQVQYALSAPGDYLSLASEAGDDALYFSGEDVGLMNEVSSRSLGPDAVAAERLYCAEIRNSNVFNLRLADVIKSSSLTSVAGSCFGDVDVFIHSQPSGSSQLSEEDRDLESKGVDYTCIQYAEIGGSPLNNRLNGLNCWKIINDSEVFEPVDVFKG